MKAYAVLHKTTKANDGSNRWCVSKYDGSILAFIKKFENRYYATLCGTRTAKVVISKNIRPILALAIEHEYK